MLVLRRLLDETVRVGEEVVVAELTVKHNLVAPGIEVPGDVSIVREEIADIACPEKAVDGGEAKRRSPPPDRDDKEDP